MRFGSTLTAAATLVAACTAADVDPIVIKVRRMRMPCLQRLQLTFRDGIGFKVLLQD